MRKVAGKAESDDLVKFLETLQREDELGLIVRAHILIENQLENFLSNYLPAPEELKGINYSTKIKLALACGMNIDLKSSLKSIGYLRNDFAHESDRKITDLDVDKIIKSLPSKDATLVDSYAPFSRESDLWQGHDPTPKDKLSLCLSAIWMRVVRERNRIAL